MAGDGSSETAAATGSSAGDLEEWARRLAVPWGPLLTQEEAQRGLAYYGSGARLQQLARKLMDGKAIKASPTHPASFRSLCPTLQG